MLLIKGWDARDGDDVKSESTDSKIKVKDVPDTQIYATGEVELKYVDPTSPTSACLQMLPESEGASSESLSSLSLLPPPEFQSELSAYRKTTNVKNDTVDEERIPSAAVWSEDKAAGNMVSRSDEFWSRRKNEMLEMNRRSLSFQISGANPVSTDRQVSPEKQEHGRSSRPISEASIKVGDKKLLVHFFNLLHILLLVLINSSPSLTFNVTRMQYVMNYMLNAALRQCWTVSSCQNVFLFFLLTGYPSCC